MRRRAEPTDGATPFRALNTTPLIDVMLCLLVMMILFYPLRTHSLTLDGTKNFAVYDCCYEPGERNKIIVSRDGTLFWNGKVATTADIRFYLAETRKIVPEPELQFEPDPEANFAVVDSVLATIERSGVGTVGIVGNERYIRAF